MAHGGAQAVFGLGDGLGTHSVNTSDDLRVGSVVKSKMNVSVCAGIDEQASTSIPLEGITSSDLIESITVFTINTDTNDVAGVHSRDAGDLVPGTDVVTATSNLEDNAGGFYVITWMSAA